jgi:hypothetical protein
MSKFEKGHTYILNKKKKDKELSQIVHIDSILPNKSVKVINNLHIIIPKLSQKYYLPTEIWDYIISYIYAPTLYEYHYGLFGFHEGFCKEKNLRELTPEENKLKNEGMYMKLPHQFYDVPPNW